LDLRQHALGHAAHLGEFADRPPPVQPELAHALRDDRAERLAHTAGELLAHRVLVTHRGSPQSRHVEYRKPAGTHRDRGWCHGPLRTNSSPRWCLLARDRVYWAWTP